MAIKKKIKRNPANMRIGAEGGEFPTARTGIMGGPLKGANMPEGSFDSGISQGIKAAISANPSLQNMTEQTIAAEQAVENLPKKAPIMKAKVKSKGREQIMGELEGKKEFPNVAMESEAKKKGKKVKRIYYQGK